MARGEGKTAGAVSLGLSLSLAALLLVMTTAADHGPPPLPEPPPAEVSEVADTPAEPDLSAVFLPPPPQLVLAAEPAASPSPEPPPPTDPPVVAPEPPIAAAAIKQAAVPVSASQPPPVPQTASRPPPQSPPAPVTITPEAIREGRALLRLLEQGEGPDIEIAWPAVAADRSDLYRLFSKCFGMRTVVMTGDGEIFDANGGRLTGETLNADRYSGFVRQPAGGLSSDERAQVNAIRHRHGLNRGRVLRLFPRRIDAILLGGLHRIAGKSLSGDVRIRARYHAADNGIEVADIHVDGRVANEIIVLPFTAQRVCRAALSG